MTPPPPPPSSAGAPAVPRNVVVILLDSLNRHLLGAYGSDEFDTPNLDRLAARSLRFDRHQTGSLPCMPARHDILCGALDFLWRPWGSIEVWEDPITFPLRTAGVTTMLVSDHPHLFEAGGENYHTDFDGWAYVRGHEGDPWRTAADPSWAGAPALPAREGWVHHAYDENRTWFRDEADFPGPQTMQRAARWLAEEAPAADRFLLFVDEFDAADSYHRWADDVDVLADLGLTAYRFSVEWARVEPEPGVVSRAALQHYRRIVDALVDRGIEPVVTLHHFTEPRWFARAGGWAGAPDATERFAAYVAALAPVLEGVGWAVTINEPNIAAVMAAVIRAMRGETVAGDGLGPLPLPHEPTTRAFVDAHRAARDVLHDRHPDMQVGWSVATQVVQALPGGEAAADAFRETREDVYLRVSAEDDFVGVQSYSRTVFGPDGTVRDDPEETRTINGWEYYPETLGEAVRHTRDVVGPDVAILVTENGIATADDDRRIAYTATALEGLRAAMDDGVDVRGYLHWSLLDNYEWGSYTPTFGLVAWDPETFDRHPKPSARWLGDLARRTAAT